ncbi:MAG: hypothetical protein KGZ69_15970 [Methylomonas sp.]|nr:hypothetical protein [Methylomonas sp.]
MTDGLLKKISLLAGGIVSVAAASVALWQAGAYVASRADAADVDALKAGQVEIAGISYSTAISEQRRYVVWLEQQLRDAEARGEADQAQQLRYLIEQAKDALAQLEQGRAKYR